MSTARSAASDRALSLRQAAEVKLTPSGAAHLMHWGVIQATGPDAASFLQGQLSNDVMSMDSESVRLAGYCSAKGRLLATFIVWRPAQDVFMLACSADLLAPTLKRLSMFVLRARCRLHDATAEGVLRGHWQATDSPSATTRAPAQRLSLMPAMVGDARWSRWLEWSTPAVTAVDEVDARALASWDWLEVASATPRVVASTTDAWVPQMVNLELLQGVDFRKGCYPGQEVVARSQYRGTLKRRMHVYVSDAQAEPMRPGAELFHASDPEQPVGSIVNVASLGGASLATVSLKTAVLTASTGADLQARHAADLTTTWLHSTAPYQVPDEALDP